MAFLDIAEVARLSGLAPSALRFYERKGLIAADARNGLRRAYDPGVIERLELIRCARDAGFTLGQIASFLSVRPSDTTLRAHIAAKEREVDARIAQLTRLRDSLRHVAVCDHDPVVECPEFKQAVRRAGPA
ncbi:MerR family transcriptional regulator [Nonomuraea sp. NPDC050663]|uniref:MerR family transcriptional regulator n=1 Tax=Nonomuraea sp. NPDC050663 TaxID=3364370 RepID=UPI0037889A05